MFVYKNHSFIIIHEDEIIIFIVFERLTRISQDNILWIDLSNTAKVCAMMNNATVHKVQVLNEAYIT